LPIYSKKYTLRELESEVTLEEESPWSSKLKNGITGWSSAVKKSPVALAESTNRDSTFSK